MDQIRLNFYAVFPSLLEISIDVCVSSLIFSLRWVIDEIQTQQRDAFLCTLVVACLKHTQCVPEQFGVFMSSCSGGKQCELRFFSPHQALGGKIMQTRLV